MKKILIAILLIAIFFSCSKKVIMEDTTYAIFKGIGVSETLKIKDVSNSAFGYGYNFIERSYDTLRKIENIDNYDIIIYTENKEIILIKLKKE